MTGSVNKISRLCLIQEMPDLFQHDKQFYNCRQLIWDFRLLRGICWCNVHTGIY